MTASPEHPPVVVGVDVPPPYAALSAAAREAQHARAALLLIHAWGTPPGAYDGPVLVAETEHFLRERGEESLREAADFLAERFPRLEIVSGVVAGDPGWALPENARDAAMIVLGSAPGAPGRRLFPVLSVTLSVVARARCPVMVAREETGASPEEPFLVVGVDGSAASREAVRTAFARAEAEGVALRAVYAWHSPLLGSLDEHAALREAGQVLDRTVQPLRERHPGVDAGQRVVRGHPVEVLTGEAAGALGVIVGTRGRGGFSGMLLGSVSQGVLRHAGCTVICVPAAGS